MASGLKSAPRILVIRLRSLGDSILALPLFEALHNWRPDLELDVLIEAPYAPVFVHHPAVHEVLAVRTRNQDSPGGMTRLEAAWEIRKRSYPAVINLHGGTTSMLFVLASGAELRIGEASHRCSRIYTVPIPPSSVIWRKNALHTIEHQLSLARWLGIPVPEEPVSALQVNQTAMARIRRRLAHAGVSEYFLIHPTATLASKQWSEDKFARLGDYLRRRHGLPVIFSAASSEIKVLQAIQKAAKESHIYWADLPLEDLFALIDGCRLFVGNDSGPTHAASALGKPVVVVWGSSNFTAWSPRGTQYEVVRSDLPCIPCPGYTCDVFGKPKCILEIPVSKVSEACDNLLTADFKNP